VLRRSSPEKGVKGIGFVEALKRFEADSETAGVILIGEIGGADEEEAARWIGENGTKPVVGFVAGRTAPPGRRMGHAGAIISGAEGGAESKIDALRQAGCAVAETPALMGESVAQALGV
jgi:succinyl-CoA synthetase alpha subunit